MGGKNKSTTRRLVSSHSGSYVMCVGTCLNTTSNSLPTKQRLLKTASTSSVLLKRGTPPHPSHALQTTCIIVHPRHHPNTDGIHHSLCPVARGHIKEAVAVLDMKADRSAEMHIIASNTNCAPSRVKTSTTNVVGGLLLATG